jgi:hypothetical protein
MDSLSLLGEAAKQQMESQNQLIEIDFRLIICFKLPMGGALSPIGVKKLPMGGSPSPMGAIKLPIGESPSPMGTVKLPMGEWNMPRGYCL